MALRWLVFASALRLTYAATVKAHRLRTDAEPSNKDGDKDSSKGQWVHWVFVTDCSAYMYNQGNLMLASAHHVDQPGEFTWIAYGCDRDDQKQQMKMLAHPRAKVWYVPESKLTHPLTGAEYKPFQASNRPLAIKDWWQKAKPKEEAIGILDPDEMWMRPVYFVENPKASSKTTDGPWETQAVKPKMAHAARYGIGCVFGRVGSERTLKAMCDGNQECMEQAQSPECSQSYSSGPPWVLHRADADGVFGDWIGNAILMHESWPDMLAEQGSYGITQARHGVKSSVDPYWFISAVEGDQPWEYLFKVSYDPCRSRSPPSTNLSLPPLWHACSTYEIPHLVGQGFRLHKDHIHKDVLECGAPLLHYPPEDALERYYDKASGKLTPTDENGFMQTWSVCAYTNLVNHHVASYKNQYCEKPNLETTFSYPDHSQGFLQEGGHIEHVFRKGGWTDVDYKIGRSLLQIGSQVYHGLHSLYSSL